MNIFRDGNCFPRACSYLVTKHQERYAEFCVQIIYELVLQKNMYLSDDYVSKRASIVHDRGNTVDQIAMFFEQYNPVQRLANEEYFKLKVLNICTDGACMGMGQILAAANIMQHPIQSVYPDVKQIVRPDLNRMVYCYNEEFNSTPLLHIMWMPMAVNSEDQCHFVLLLKVVRKL